MTTLCEICKLPEKSRYVPPDNVYIICSTCVQTLLNMSGASLQAAHKKAVDKKNTVQASMIASFMFKSGNVDRKIAR